MLQLRGLMYMYVMYCIHSLLHPSATARVPAFPLDCHLPRAGELGTLTVRMGCCGRYLAISRAVRPVPVNATMSAACSLVAARTAAVARASVCTAHVAQSGGKRTHRRVWVGVGGLGGGGGEGGGLEGWVGRQADECGREAEGCRGPSPALWPPAYLYPSPAACLANVGVDAVIACIVHDGLVVCMAVKRLLSLKRQAEHTCGGVVEGRGIKKRDSNACGREGSGSTSVSTSVSTSTSIRCCSLHALWLQLGHENVCSHLAADCQHGFNTGNRKLATEGLATQHNAISTIQHQVGNVCVRTQQWV